MLLAVGLWNKSPMFGTKPSIRSTFKVPPRLACPVCWIWSYWLGDHSAQFDNRRAAWRIGQRSDLDDGRAQPWTISTREVHIVQRTHAFDIAS